MYRRTLIVVLALATCVAGANFAFAAAKKGAKLKARNHAVTATITAANVSATPGTSANSTAIVDAGTVSSGSRNGAGVLTIVLTGAAGGAQSFTGTFTAFFKDGSYSGSTTGTATPQPDGTFKIAGTLNVTSGTVAFKGATGPATVTATQNKNGIVTGTVAGTLKY
jgi:hypothetical protein